MALFEEARAKTKISLFVLPRSSPQYNGGVERGNRIFREEFYTRTDINADSIGAFKLELKKAVQKYNSYRPHFRLNALTNFEYTNQILVT